MKRKKKKASRIFSFILAMMFLTTAFFSNLVDAKERNLSDNSSVDKQERIQLAQKLGLEKWIDSDGYLSEDYYKDKTNLELSEMGVAPLIHTIDLNSEVMTLSVTKYQKVSYGNTIVGYFEVDGYPSLCCEHDRDTPEADSPTGSWEEITDTSLRTVMYYGYTGPGNIFSDYNQGCVGTSLALSYYVRGLSSTGMGGPHSSGAEKVGMSQLIYKVEQNAAVPSGFKVYCVTTNGGSTQRLMFSIYNPKTYTSLTVQKTWNDQYDKFGIRPSAVTVDLYWWSNVDSTRYYYKTAELTAANNWTVTWDNLERSDGNVMYEYTAVEREVPNYSSEMQWYGSYENGWTAYITNTLKTYTSLTVNKLWNDQGNKYDSRPSDITVDLYWWSNKDSTRHYYKTAKLSKANNWTVTWDNLEYTDGDTTYEYTAVEKGDVPNYSGKMKWTGSYQDGWTADITNTLKTYTSLSVKKLWDDQENQFELQPSSIKVNLYWWSNKDSTRHYYKTATLSAENNWFVTWDNLEYVDGDTTYGYDVEEEEVSEYTGKMQWTGSYKDGWVGSLTNSLKTGNAKVLKTSTSPELTDGNECYSLKDAVYGIYTTADCKESSLVALMTTKENGESDAVTVPIGTYHVKEVTAPKGYALDKKIHTVEIKLGETYLLKVSDKPTMDPVGVLLGKIDKETNQNKPEGSLPMEGALFEVKFYAGVQMDSDPAESGKKATRSWVFRTNENGFIYYEKKYLSSGDELYMSLDGNPGLPIGTLTFKETQAPEGYLLNPEIYTVKITSNNDGSEFVNTYNAPKIPEQSLDLNLVKKEQGKDYVIEGVVFELTKPDGSTETATTDANGTCKFKALGYGKYKVREISAPGGYAVNNGVVTFTVAKDNSITVDSNTSVDDSMKFSVESTGTALLSVEDTLAPYKLKITKVNEKGTTLEDAEFTIYEDKECKHELDKIVTDKTGIATTNPLAVEKLYYIKETKAPQGYRIPQDAQGKEYVYEIYTKINDKKQYEYYVNGELHTKDSGDYAIEGTVNERIVNLKVENQTTLQMPNTGTHTTLLIVLLGVSCMTVALIRQTKRGKKEKKDEKSEKL